MRLLSFVLSFIFIFQCVVNASEEKILEASNSLQLMIRKYKEQIPKDLILQSKAIAVFPSVTKIGFLIGGLHGEGVMSIKKDNSWSLPCTVDLSGGSLGLQLGVENSDIVLFILKEQAAEDILKGKFTLGVDASVATGNLGTNMTQMTDIKFTEDIYVYKLNKGLFAGVSMDGAVVQGSNCVKKEEESFSTRVFVETLKKLEQ